MLQALVQTAVQVHEKVRAMFLPTPERLHYLFSLRHISAIFRSAPSVFGWWLYSSPTGMVCGSYWYGLWLLLVWFVAPTGMVCGSYWYGLWLLLVWFVAPTGMVCGSYCMACGSCQYGLWLLPVWLVAPDTGLSVTVCGFYCILAFQETVPRSGAGQQLT